MDERRVAGEDYRWTDDFADVFPEDSALNYALIDIRGIIRYHSPGLGELTSARLTSLVGTRADQLFLRFMLPTTSRGEGMMRLRSPNGCDKLKAFWKRTRAGFLYLFVNIESFFMEALPRGLLSVAQTHDLLHDLRTTLTTIQLAAHEIKPVNPFDERQGERVQLILRESWAQERIFTAVGALTRFSQPRPVFSFNDYLQNILNNFEYNLQARGKSFSATISSRFPTVHCDPKRLEQCLWQLICLAGNDREARFLHLAVALSEDEKRVEFDLRVQPPRAHRVCAEQFSLALIHQVASEHSGQLTAFEDGYLLTIAILPDDYDPDCLENTDTATP